MDVLLLRWRGYRLVPAPIQAALPLHMSRHRRSPIPPPAIRPTRDWDKGMNESTQKRSSRKRSSMTPGIIDESRYDEWRTLPAMFFDQAERLGDRPLLISKQAGVWRESTWSEAAGAVARAAGGLKSLGVGHGDRVAIVSENRPEWLIADFAVMLQGAITVPAYTTSTTADHLHTLRDSGARVVLVSSAALMRKVLPAALQLPDTRAVVSFNEDAGA